MTYNIKDAAQGPSAVGQAGISPNTQQQNNFYAVLPAAGCDNIASTLNERGRNYGNFEQQARVSESIKSAIHNGPNWWSLGADGREALDIIAVKIGRLLSGNPNHIDSWHDIQGYAKLVEDRLLRDEKMAALKCAAAQQQALAQATTEAYSNQTPKPTPIKRSWE